jgi:predicted TIM-barrel fold metal-dependent hydrolase
MSERIDAYAHIGRPRFVTVEQYLAIMDRHGIQRAVVAAADTCPDIGEVSRAILEYPQRFRAVGVPLGETFAEISASLRKQAECGFLGIRIFDRMLAEHPRLLGVMVELNLIPWVVGSPALAPAAGLLADYLKGAEDRLVVAPHFGGAASPHVLEENSAVRELFEHPRLLVIFSRHGAYDPVLVRGWAAALAAKIGWKRILFGSEFPVCLWRNESYQSTLDWARVLFPDLDADAFAGGNAWRYLWQRPVPTPRRVDAPPPPGAGMINLFARQGLEIPEKLHQRLLARYLREGSGDADYRAFITRLLLEGDPQPSDG